MYVMEYSNMAIKYLQLGEDFFYKRTEFSRNRDSGYLVF